MKLMDFRRFHRDEEGAITAFILVMFLLMVVAGGMAVDFMRHEAERVRLQDAIDRGVLSATSFEQLDSSGNEYNAPYDVVASYLSAEGYDMSDTNFVLAVNPDPSNSQGQRRIDAGALYDINTFFLRLINIPTLTVAAVSSAETRYSDLELSLVLDVSGSMSWPAAGQGQPGDPRIDDLIVAAHAFIDAIVTPQNEDKTSVSIIPFSANVNPGELLANQIPGYDRWHNYSSCFEFNRAANSDFATTAISLDPSAGYEQSQHFQLSAWRSNDPRLFWCPRESNAITLPTNNKGLLKAAIDALDFEYYTASWQGMKWAAALLDPSLRPAFQTLSTTMVNRPTYADDGTIANPALVAEPAIPTDFANRPADFNGQTQKYIVLMSDGDNTLHTRIQPTAYNVTGAADWRDQANADYWNTAWETVSSSNINDMDPNYSYTTSTQRECTGPRWNRVCTDVTYYSQTVPASDQSQSPVNPSNSQLEGSAWEIDNAPSCGWNCTSYDGEGDVILQEICNAAKANDIVVYTIGFAIKKPSWITADTVVTLQQAINLDHDQYAAYSELYQCATDGSKFYHAANAAELSEAFAAIAASISHLKLVATE